MLVEFITAGGVGRGRPLVLAVNQVIVRQDNGTPILVAAEFGAEKAQAAAKVGDADFQHLLRALGINETVVCDRVELPGPPPGARLIAGPDVKRGT